MRILDQKKSRSTQAIQGGLIAALAALVASVLILAAVPPVDRDALTHHLAVPKLYLRHGGMVEIPHVPFSYYPMNLDLLYLAPLALGNDIAPKYIHFAFALLTAVLIFSYLRRRLESRTYALLGALMFLSLPVIVKLSITVYVDLGLVFFSTAALLQLLQWAGEGHRWRNLVWGGIWCGLALGTKYNALVTFFLLACLVPILYLRGARHSPLHDSANPSSLRAAGAAIVFFLAAAAVFSPWMVRNAAWTGNPVYPLFQGVFNRFGTGPPFAPAIKVDNSGEEAMTQGINHFTVRRVVFKESLLETLTIPVRVFFQGEDDNPKYFDGRLNPYLLFFPLLSFIGRHRISPRWRLDNTVLGLFSVLYLLYAFLQTDMRIRYVAPILPPLVILSVIGIHSLVQFFQSRWPTGKTKAGIRCVALVVGFFLIPNALYLISQFRAVDPLSYLTGEVSRDGYIQKFRPEYAAIQYINQRLPLESRILGLYIGNRRYYSDRHMEFDESFFRKAIRSSDSPARLSAILKERGLSHIFVRQDMFDAYILGNLDGERRKLFQDWIDTHAFELFCANGYRLIELRPSLL